LETARRRFVPDMTDFTEAKAIEAALLADCETRYTPSGDGTMAWRLWGAGPPLVMLHGGSGSWRHWVRNIRALAEHYRLYVADIPGLGDSASAPKPFDTGDFPGSVDQLAEVISAGIAELLPGDDPFKLLGFSFGSITSGYVAARMNDRIEHLALVGAGALGQGWPDMKGERRSPRGAKTEEEVYDVHRHNLHLVMFHDAGKIDDLALYLQLENIARARIRSHSISGTDTLYRALIRTTMPISGLWGEHDVYAQPRVEDRVELFRELRPGADCRVIDGAGHWVMYEAAERFNAAILEQLGGTAAARKAG
jgi:2-hydroxy-6-oxonona-2,4-dienedioate hydrolase